MTSRRNASSRVLVAVALALVSSAAIVPALDAPQPAPGNGAAIVVDHWPPHDDDLYGPHFITANPSAETWYEDFFSTRLVSGAKYYLKVNNPAPDGPGPVGNFSVMLNGVYVADPGMMSGESELVKEVPLQAWNRIEVWTAPGTGQLRVMITIVPMTHIAPTWAVRVQPEPGQVNVTKSWQVTVPADAGGNRVMVVDNGDYDRTGRIGEQEWGEIKINGVRAVWLDTLHTEQSKLVVPVTLPNGTSTIEAFLGNAVPGAHINVRVMYADTAKPKLVVTAPANNAVVASPSVTVSGTYDDPMWGSVNVGTAASYQSVWLGHMAGVQPWSVSHPLSEGSNTIKIWARDGAGNTSDTVTRVVIRSTQGQGPATPTLALAPEQAYGKLRDPSVCAAECFEATASYSTPAYISLDEPRSVTLVYRSDQAAPHGIVLVDATDPGPTAAAKMSIKVRRPDGTFVPSSSGATEIFYATSLGANRLAFRFAANDVGTVSLDYTAVVTAFDAAGAPSAPAEMPVSVLIVNEQSSPFGAGWSMVGLGRVYEQPGGSLVITNGDGSASYFEVVSCPSTCSYTRPSGDYSTVTRRASWSANGTKWDRIFPDGTHIEYRADGQIATVADRFGNFTYYDYNAAGQLVLIQDPVFLLTGLDYDANGKLHGITTPGNRTTGFTVNASGDLTQVVDPDGVAALTLAYDASHRLTTRVDRRGGEWGYAYDFAGKLAADTMPQITADGGLMRPVTKFRSLETASLVDPNSGHGTSGNPAPRMRPDTLRAIVTNPRGHATKLLVDRFGAPTRIEEPLGRVTQIGRDFAGRAQRVVSPSGHTMQYTYSSTLPNLNRMHDSTTGRQINYEYDSTRFNLLTRASGHTAQVVHALDASGKLVERTTVGGTSTSSFTYDARGRMLTSRDQESHVVQYAYAPPASGFQNLKSVTAAGRTTKYGHDAFGRVIADTAHDGSVTSRRYDLLNRDTLRVGPMNDTTITRYDSLFVRAVRDPNGQLYRFARNALGWVESDTFPVPAGVIAVRSYGYDRNGNVLSVVNRRAQTVTFTYDELDNPLSRVADGQTTAFGTSAVDLFKAASNGESVDTLKLDIAGRPAKEITVRGGQRYERTSTFDLHDLRTALSISTPWAASIGYGYDAKLRLDQVTDVAGGLTSLGEDGDFLPATIGLPTSPGLTISKDHPATHTPSAVVYNDGGINFELGVNYAYNEVAQVSKRILAGRSDQTTQVGREFRYDRLRRLTAYHDFVDTATTSSCAPQIVDENGNSCITPGSSTISNQNTFAYDLVGNRSDSSAVVLAGNRLVRFRDDTMTYDADGNLTRRWRLAGGFDQSLSWNSLGQLTSVTTNGVAVSFAYDGFGRRVWKSSAGGTSVYLWDGDNLFAELDGAGNRVAEYTYYPELDQPHSVRRWSDGVAMMYYFATDHPGNVVGLINASRQLVGRYGYRAFGTIEDSSGAVLNPLRFAARELDGETGLYYVRARYYDPSLGRFVSEDPIGLEGGINPYVYAGNDPVNETDPTGLERCNDVAFKFTDENGDVHTGTVRLCRGGGSGPVIGQILDFAAGLGVGSGSGSWGGGVFATGAGTFPRGRFFEEVELKRDTKWVGCARRSIRFTSTDHHGQQGTWTLTRRRVAGPGKIRIRRVPVNAQIGIYSGTFKSPSYARPLAAFGQLFCQVGVGLFEAK